MQTNAIFTNQNSLSKIKKVTLALNWNFLERVISKKQKMRNHVLTGNSWIDIAQSAGAVEYTDCTSAAG